MAMGKRRRRRQKSLWIEPSSIKTGPGHPFYERLNQLLDRHDFDELVERECARFYAEKMGRPSLAPAVYFRLLLIGYFEGIDSERGIAWRVADSISLRKFLGYELTDAPPDHSTVSRTRRLIDQEAHEAVFGKVLQILAKEGLVKGKTLGIDATTLEANAAMRSIERKDTGETYREYLVGLAKASGIETPTREELTRLDKKRPKKTSNDDWHNPHDPDARITKMKDGRTHLAHKAEHAVDLETGAVVAVTVQPADRGDTSSMENTLAEVYAGFDDVLADPEAADKIRDTFFSEVVADKGYHSNELLRRCREAGLRTYISEPDRGRRNWKRKAQEKQAVYANRRRIRGERGRRFLRQRAEKVERPMAHAYETGGMRRTHLRGHPNIQKRLLIHFAGLNLGLVMRKYFGKGTPRGLQGLRTVIFAFLRLIQRLPRISAALLWRTRRFLSGFQSATAVSLPWLTGMPELAESTSATGC
jgi:transposase